jgi:hypothetical protein
VTNSKKFPLFVYLLKIAIFCWVFSFPPSIHLPVTEHSSLLMFKSNIHSDYVIAKTHYESKENKRGGLPEFYSPLHKDSFAFYNEKFESIPEFFFSYHFSQLRNSISIRAPPHFFFSV